MMPRPEQYILADGAGWNDRLRFTHYPSRMTCLYQPFMTEAMWEAHQIAFFELCENLPVFREHENEPYTTVGELLIDLLRKYDNNDDARAMQMLHTSRGDFARKLSQGLYRLKML